MDNVLKYIKLIVKIATIVPILYKGIEKAIEELKNDIQTVF